MTEETKFDPMKDINNLRDSVSKAIEQGIQQITGSFTLKVDMYELDDQIVLRTSPLDGIVPDSIDINVENNSLILSGRTEPEDTPKGASYLVHERRFGAFTRTLGLPVPVKSALAEAKLKNGILTVTLPIDREPHQNIRVIPIE